MFDMIAEVVIGLLKSLYGLSVSVVSGVINTVVTGTFIVRKTGGTAGTDELQISHQAASGTLFKDMRSQIQLGPNSGGTGSLIQIVDTVNASNFTKFDFSATSLKFLSGLVLTWDSSSTATNGGTDDLKVDRPAAGVLRVSGTTLGSGGWLQNTGGEARRTATQTVTDSATFAADDTLSITVISGRKYRFLLEYFFTTVNTSGVKVDLNGGSAAMTAINGMAFLYSSAGAVGNAVQITALTSSPALTASGTFAYVTISGSFQPSGNGTFVPRFAQNAETGAAESAIAQIGSYLTLADVP